MERLGIMSMNESICSTGEILTIPEREDEARKYLKKSLKRIALNLLILGELAAAELCDQARDAIGK